MTEQLCLLQRLNIESQAECERNGQIRSSEIINNTFTFLTSTPSSGRTLLGKFCSETKGKKSLYLKTSTEGAGPQQRSAAEQGSSSNNFS